MRRGMILGKVSPGLDATIAAVLDGASDLLRGEYAGCAPVSGKPMRLNSSTKVGQCF